MSFFDARRRLRERAAAAGTPSAPAPLPQSVWSQPDWQNPLLTREPKDVPSPLPNTRSSPPSTSREPGGIVGPFPPSTPKPFDPQAFRSGWESGGAGVSPEDLKRYVSQFQGVSLRPGGKGDKVVLPNGQVIDMIYSTGSPQARAQWLDVTGGGAPSAPAPWAAAAPGAGQPGGRPGGVFGGEEGSALFKLLMSRATQGLDVKSTDPIIRNQVDAFRAQKQKQEREYEANLAERGGPNANLTAETRLGSEEVGQATGGFEAELMGRELSARRQEIQHALSGAAGLLTAEQRMQLQQELQQLDRAQQESQFGRTIGQRESEFGRTLGQRGYEFDINDLYRNSPLYG